MGVIMDVSTFINIRNNFIGLRKLQYLAVATKSAIPRFLIPLPNFKINNERNLYKMLSLLILYILHFLK